MYIYTHTHTHTQCNPDIRELSGPGEEISYIRVWSILFRQYRL